MEDLNITLNLPFKVMFKTQLMELILILLQFIIVPDRKVQTHFSINDALPQTTNNIIITFKLSKLSLQ